jgi:hypothetical protein
MFSLEGERRRKINLGGVSATSSQASILERVHAQRLARAETKRRVDSATRIQAWYRGLREARALRMELRKLFAEDVLSLTAMRCLVLIGRDDGVLSTWAASVLAGGEGLTHDLPTDNLPFSCSFQARYSPLQTVIKESTGLSSCARRASSFCNQQRRIHCGSHRDSPSNSSCFNIIADLQTQSSTASTSMYYFRSSPRLWPLAAKDRLWFEPSSTI